MTSRRVVGRQDTVLLGNAVIAGQQFAKRLLDNAGDRPASLSARLRTCCISESGRFIVVLMHTSISDRYACAHRLSVVLGTGWLIGHLPPPIA